MKKVFHLSFFALAVVLNFSIMLVLTASEVNAQNCVCAECNASCESIASYGHKQSCSFYVAPSSSSSASSSSSSYSGSSASYSPGVQMAQSLIEPALDAFFTWLFTGPSADSQQKKLQKEQEKLDAIEYAKQQAEYHKKVEEQIANAKSEYDKILASQSLDKKAEVIADFQNRLAVSEATKTVKQLNCAAFKSLEAYKTSLNDFGDFKNLEGSAEQTRKLADFPSSNVSQCPVIKINIPEVNAAQPISFQQLLYGYVKQRSDSIKSTIDTLKLKKVKNDKVIEEKKQKIEETKVIIEKQKTETDSGTGNQLLLDAMKELEAATKELETAEDNEAKMKEELELKEKNYEALEKMRSTYDLDNNPTTTDPTIK